MSLPDSVERVLSASRFVGRTGKENSGAARSTRSNLEVIQKLFHEIQPQRSLEIGLAIGASATLFADLYRQGGANPSRQHIAIDPFQSSVWDSIAVDNLTKEELAGYVDVIEEFSEFALPKMIQSGDRFDIIYVDGGHLFENVFIDLIFASRLLSKGGIVLFDDAADPHVAKAMQFCRTSLSQGLSEIDLRNYKDFGSRVDRTKYSIARALRKTQLAAFKCSGDVVREWDARFVPF